MPVGKVIKKISSDKQMSIKDLSKKSKIPYGTLTNIISNDPEDISTKTLKKLAEAFNETPEWLLLQITAENVEKDNFSLLHPLFYQYLKEKNVEYTLTDDYLIIFNPDDSKITLTYNEINIISQQLNTTCEAMLDLIIEKKTTKYK